MTRITQGTGRNLIPSACADASDLVGPLQLLHELLGSPNLRRSNEEPPPSVGSVRWLSFTLKETFAAQSPSNQAAADVLDLDGSDSGFDAQVYDPVGLWSSAAGTESGWGFLSRHPTTGDQVIFVISTLPAGGSGDGNDKVKVNSSDTADYLEDQFENHYGSATYSASTDALISSETVDDGGDKLIRLFLEDVVDTDELVAVDGSNTPGYLAAQFNNTDLSGTIPGGTQQVFFSTTGSSPSKTVYAYTDEVSSTDVLVKINSSETSAGYLEDQLVNSGTLTSGYQRVYFRKNGNDSMYAETEEASGSSVSLFDCLISYGQSLTAGSWDDGAREWTDGGGTVTLLTDNGDGTYDEGSTQAVKWRPNFAVTPPSGKAFRGHGVIDNGVYKLEAVYTCEGVDWTSGE